MGHGPPTKSQAPPQKLGYSLFHAELYVVRFVYFVYFVFQNKLLCSPSMKNPDYGTELGEFLEGLSKLFGELLRDLDKLFGELGELFGELGELLNLLGELGELLGEFSELFGG